MAVKIFKDGSWKSVSSIKIMQSGEWKDVEKGYIAPVQGAVNKLFYQKTPDWAYHTGIILNSSTGYAAMSVGSYISLTPSVGEEVRPVTIEFNVDARIAGGQNSKLRYKVEYSTDGANWTALATQDESITTEFYYTYNCVFTMNGSTNARYLRFTLSNVGSYYVYRNSMSVKCTAWWAQG